MGFGGLVLALCLSAAASNILTDNTSGQWMSRLPTYSAATLIWTLDEGASPWANTGSAGALNLASTGSPVLAKSVGMFNYGESLTSSTSNFIMTANTSLGESSVDFTIAVWAVQYSGSATFSPIIVKNINTASWAAPFGIGIQWYGSGAATGYLQASLVYGASSQTTIDTHLRLYNQIPIGQWFLAAVTYVKSTGTFSLYLNGDLVGSNTTAGAGTAPTWGSHGSWIIGSEPGATDAVTGRWDQIVVENVAETQATLHTWYMNGLGSFTNQ